MHLHELKEKPPGELLAFAEELKIENASTMRKQDMMFAILKQLADNSEAIHGAGVLEILQDGLWKSSKDGINCTIIEISIIHCFIITLVTRSCIIN